MREYLAIIIEELRFDECSPATGVDDLADRFENTGFSVYCSEEIHL